MPTLKIQGQVYRSIGSIYSVQENQEKFLQVYLDLQSQTRCNNVLDLDKDLITELQFMLHQNNIFIQNLKSTIDSTLRDCVYFKIIIRSNKRVDQHT